MTLSRNLLAGMANSIWSALVGLIVVPFYLKYLGIDAYGLIGFFVSSQAILMLLDMGMASTINREVARCHALGDLKSSGKLLHSLAVVYWTIAAMIAALFALLTPWIARYWLQSGKLTPTTIAHAVTIMGLVIAFRWPVGLYEGVLIGAQRQTVSSCINMAMATIASLGAILVIAFVSPTIEAFFVWQSCVGLVYALVMRWAAWRVIGRSGTYRFNLGEIHRIFSFSLGVGAITLFGLLLTQVDKLILSKTLDLANFGKYMLAAIVAGSLYMLIVPVFNTAYPRFSHLVAQKQLDELFSQYRNSTRLFSILLFPIAMALALLARPLVYLWTGDAELAVEVEPLASLLLVGYALHGIMHLPYALMLAQGETRAMYKVYILLVVTVLPLAAGLSLKYGAIGGAWAQLVHFVLYMGLGAIVTHARFFKGYARKWLSTDVGGPLGISLLSGGIGFFVIQLTGNRLYVTLAVGAASWAVATSVGIYSSQFARLVFADYWRRFHVGEREE